MKKATFMFTLLFLAGCNAGERFGNFFNWIIEHPGAFIGIVALLIPVLSLIPGVGPVLAATLTKILVTLSPVLKQISEQYNKDSKIAYIDERVLAEQLEKEIVENPDTKLGTVPGTRIIARIAARRLAKEAKKKNRS